MSEATETGQKHTGDFAMFNPLPLLRDEDGQYLCPLPVYVTRYDDVTDEPHTEAVGCGEPLHVHWHLFAQVPDHDGPTPTMTTEDAAGWAEFSWWELTCSNGHVLRSSRGDDMDGRCVPFDARMAWGGGV